MTAAVGRLVVVGTGIRTTGQLTVEAIAWMKAADRLFHLVADPVALEVIRACRPDGATDLRDHYTDGGPRRRAYESMAEAIVAELDRGATVCAAFYGHPGVFARAPHLAVELARRRGHRADMLPAVSAEDCLFAELLIDPGDGCAQYEATNFLLHDHVPDTTIHLLLWQIGMLGDWTHRTDRDPSHNLALLADKLAEWYPRDHPVTVYQASVHLDTPPRADRVPLHGLPDAAVGASCTLYVPPAAPLRPDVRYLDRLERFT